VQWVSFGIGLGSGLLVSIPLLLIAVRRTTRRVRRLEQRARTSDRLAELGTLTGGLAHEIKNPLSTVGLNIQLLQEDLDTIAQQVASDRPVYEQIGRTRRRFESLTRETHRLRDILADFLRFAGRVNLHRVPTHVNDLIHELVDFFAPQAQADSIHLRTQLTPQASIVSVDVGLLKQALLNILINATQAMVQAREENQPSGGSDELIIRTHSAREGDRDEIHIHLTDTGPGIGPDKLAKIFHPYYSAKKGGTGLGLATARRIVEEHGGSLNVHSELGRGTDFIVAIPVADEDELAGDAVAG